MYEALRVVLGPGVRFLTSPAITGGLPSRGPVIVAANHTAELDSLLLAAVTRRRVTFIAKSEYFHRNPTAGQFLSRLCQVTGQIPVDRADPRGAQKALAQARNLLVDGGVWGIYPEGTRSPDGRTFRGHTGAMRVALSLSTVQVVPTGIVGMRQVNAPGQPLRRGHVEVRFGEPLDLSPWVGRSEDPGAVREATDFLMTRIASLAGTEYVDRYASKPRRPAQPESRLRVR